MVPLKTVFLNLRYARAAILYLFSLAYPRPWMQTLYFLSFNYWTDLFVKKALNFIILILSLVFNKRGQRQAREHFLKLQTH
jgi:hypothetical protein